MATRSLTRSYAKVSSGLRITRAADDAAGLGVADSLGAQYGSLRQAMRNTNDGISIIQTAEGATNEVSSMLKRLRELAVQGASETLATEERSYVDEEAQQLILEIQRIADTTEFNGLKLSDGSTSAFDVQVGVNNTTNDRIALTTSDLSIATLAINALQFDTATGSQDGINALDTALDSVNSYRSTFGALQNRLESTLNNLSVYGENLQAAESQIRDADFAYETAELSKKTIMQQAGVAVLSQAKMLGQSALALIG
jgi:flagellin